MQKWQNHQKIQNLVNQKIQNIVNQKIQSSLSCFMLDRAMYGPGLNRSLGQWEGSKNQVSTLHVLMFHHVVIVKLDECMTLWG